MGNIDIIFQLLILLFSVIIHEVAHGYAALFQGDQTAKYENRLTLNPLKHIDLFGSIILPLLFFFSGWPVFGWAKPVPFNPYNLRNRKWGEALVAFAGPAVNISIALIFSLILRFGVHYIEVWPSLIPAIFIMQMIVVINLVLAIFNLVPIAPLDGSKILFALLPASMSNVRRIMEQYSIFFVLIFVFVLWEYVAPIIGVLFYYFTGMSLS